MKGERWAAARFDEARRKAFWRAVAAFFTGRSNDLLPFEAIYARFPIRGQRYLGLRQVPLRQIVGSVGRYQEFDRAFLPREPRLRERWVKVGALMWAQRPLPPVELYQVGEVYFVKDGHHRISAAQMLGQETIDAYVTAVEVPVRLTPDLAPADLDLKAQQAAFVERTGVDRWAPDLAFEATLPEAYRRLEEHIADHHRALTQARGAEVPYEEAVRSWVAQVYRPVVEVLRRHDLTRSFPGRTETDLYLWLSEARWWPREGRPEARPEPLSPGGPMALRLPASEEALIRSPRLEALLLAMEQEGFFEHTGLQAFRAPLRLTVPGKYRKLLEHIAVHRWYLGEQQGAPVSCPEAARSWYERVFRPLADLVESTGVLEAFPERTVGDLYVWLMERREEIHRSLGWNLSAESLVRMLVEDLHRGEGWRPAQRRGQPAGPLSREVGGWRRAREKVPAPQVFPDLLVALPAEPEAWQALDQAAWIARQEGGRLHALHVRTPATRAPQAQERLWQAFARRCRAQGVTGDLAFAHGPVAEQVLRHASLVDLVVVRLAYPPGEGPLQGGGAGMRRLIHHCPRPLLAVPGEARPLRRAMLAYDGSPKADEALFLAAWLAQAWRVSLVVVAVNHPEALWQAQAYLDGRGVQAAYRRASGAVVPALLALWEAEHADWLLMGGYRRGPLVERMIGSTVNGVLAQAPRPVLLCR